ncbi:MAG: carotenoid oxygenase family protein [Chlamydiales bacterium]|nr:carotenoid oxygenase family protein [Chlamydiales bacterium]
MCALFKKSKSVSAELEEEISSRPLVSSGVIPGWLSGSLIRNGPVYVNVDGKTNAHWFDGLAMLHVFSFSNGEVRFSNKFLRSDDYKTVFKKKSLDYTGFAADPCRSLFKRFFTFFIPKKGKEIQNANVNVVKLANTYAALTEVPLPVAFEPHTLETLGVLNYKDQLPHGKCWESAHPHHDSIRKETLNYLIQYGRSSEYILYWIKDGLSEREVIARIPVEEPSYMHTFAVTDNYVIFTEFPFKVKPLDFITKNQAFIKNFLWCPERGTQFTVVERATGKLIGKYKTNSFFAFHHGNAFEKDGQIFLDLVWYADSSMVMGVASYFRPYSQDKPFDITPSPTRLERYTLNLQTGDIAQDTLLDRSVEFPRINDKFDGLPYRYLYLTDPREAEDGSPRNLYKVNVETKEVHEWQQPGCCPGEPLFISLPGASEEDEGVVLTVVQDTLQHTSFLPVLNAKNFEEIGRAEAPHYIPAGLHGQYFNIQEGVNPV